MADLSILAFILSFTATNLPTIPQTGPLVGDLTGELFVLAAWDLGSRIISAHFDADTWHDKYMKRRWMGDDA